MQTSKIHIRGIKKRHKFVKFERWLGKAANSIFNPAALFIENSLKAKHQTKANRQLLKGKKRGKGGGGTPLVKGHRLCSSSSSIYYILYKCKSNFSGRVEDRDKRQESLLQDPNYTGG